MSCTARLVLACLTLFFFLFPLTLPKPGLPAGLKADEPAYYLMALSLIRDGDLRLEVRDVDRLFQEFPFRPADNVIVMSDDGWRTVYFAKPYVYSLFAAPFAGLFGADGLVAFNLLLLMAMVWMGFAYLRRFNSEGTAALFSAGFFLLSLGFVYAFWLHPEVFNMASVAAALFFGFGRFARSGAGGGRGEEVGSAHPEPVAKAGLWTALASGACLAPAVYNKPMIALLGLPLLLEPLLVRRWKAAGAWLAGAVLAMGVVTGLAVGLTGHLTPYLGVVRQGVTLCEPGVMPIQPVVPAGGEAGSALPDDDRPTGGAWSWIFQVPTIVWPELAENLGYFLWGRHTGLLLYMPFAVLAVLYFLLRGGRSRRRWGLLATLAALALVFLVFISHNWQGGGGFVGNRYYVNLYPAFLWLVTEIRPRWATALGYSAAGLFLAPILFSPFGRGEPEPTLQGHVRNGPFRFFPLELSLREVPGYHKLWVGDRMFIGRRDVVLPRGELLWLRGASRVELWLLGQEPLEEAVFLVGSAAPDNRVRLELGEAEEVLELGAGQEVRVALAPGGPGKVVRRPGGRVRVHRMIVTPETGRIRPWTRSMRPESCSYFAYDPSSEESFFLGATLLYLGRGEALEQDVYALRWGQIEVPERVRAGEVFTLPVRLFNRSDHPWREDGAARVRLSYHWRTPDGEVVVWDGRRTDLRLPVAAGARTAVAQEIEAPAEPGRYLLELDPVFEHVSWFSRRNGGNTFRAEVEVVPAAPAGEAAAGEGGGGR